MQDPTVLEHINELAHEEERLFAKAGEGEGLEPEDVARLDWLKVELDRCYDLLRQRQARRSAGMDPDDATLRPADIVERYQQ